MNIADIYRDYVQESLLGYRPASSSIKAVHIANGLFRALLGPGPALTEFHNTLVRYKDSKEIEPADELARKYGKAVFGQFAEPKNRERLNLLREYLRQAYAADGAVFPSAQYSSYTLTHRAQITGDSNDAGTGKFIAKILTEDFGEGPSPLIKIIRELLEDETDEFTTIALPLIGQESLQLRIDLDETILIGEQQRQSSVLKSARLGFDAIAIHAAPHLRGSKLQILRYIVLFSCLVVYLHLVNRNREVNLATDGHAGYSFVPILIDFSNAGAPRIRYASQSTYRTAIKQIENLVLNGFKTFLAKEYPNLDEQVAEEVISSIEWQPSKKGKSNQSQNPNLFKGMYNAYRAKGTPILEALSAAMTDMFYKERIAPPDNFARSLGIRAGFVGPAANRAVEKYYTITPDLLEVLVLSVTSPEEDVQEAVVLTELAKRLRERYGIIIGALPDDYDYLSREGIQDADHDDLEQNAFAFQQVLVAIGKAREYADGVAVVHASIGELL